MMKGCEWNAGHYRVSLISGLTVKLTRPRADSPTAPKHPLPKPEHGRYHLVRFIRGDALLEIICKRCHGT